jgi:hypothetical protein
MRLVSMRKVLLLLACCALSFGVARANDFNNVIFTDFSAGNSIIGSGTFSFDQTLGDGTYMLSSLTNVNFDFTVEGNLFNNGNIDPSDLANVEVVIDDNGNNFYFNTDCATGMNSTGCYEDGIGGTLGFYDSNSGNVLSTEPNWYGPLPLNEYEYGPLDGSKFLGYYGTPAGLAPEPESLWLLGTGFFGLMMLRRFRRA